MVIFLNQKISKLTQSALQIKRYEYLFRCPICQSSMKVHELKSLLCSQNHTFDMARKGHIHLLTRSSKSNYDKSLFLARKRVIKESDLFEPFTTSMIKFIHQYTEKPNPLIVDMGAGEGSHLQNIYKGLKQNYNKKITAFGIDISKEGILEATKSYEDIIWIISDIANSPFADHTFDIILNILSPSNYEEFTRLLKGDGLLIKVIPGKHYLQELRKYFYKDHQDYSNENVLNSFKDNFQLIDHSILNFQNTLNETMLKSLLQMTPLTWNIKENQLQQFLSAGIYEITVHLEILVGRKKERAYD